MTKYAIFEDGFPIAFYDEDLHGPVRLVTYGDDGEVLEDEPNPNSQIPSDAVAITDEQWAEFLHHQGFRKWDGKKVVNHLPPDLPPVAVGYRFKGGNRADPTNWEKEP